MSTIGDVLSERTRWEPRFWAKVQKTDGCWLWIAGKDKDGYGKFAITLPPGGGAKQLHVRAHRVSLALAHGSAPSGDLVTIHSCDTPACVRPEHLSLGTQADNRADCGRKGRNASGNRNGARVHPETRMRGSAHWAASVTEATVFIIKALLRSGARQAEIARLTGASVAVVHQIKTAKTWRHVS